MPTKTSRSPSLCACVVQGGMSVQPPSYSVGAKHAQSQESQL